MTRLRLPTFTLLPLALCLVAAGATRADADVYRQVGADGAVSFTDAPTEDRVKLIIRESELGKRGGEKGAAAPAVACEPGRPRAAGPARLPVEGTLTSRVGLRTDPIDGLLRHHQGLDIAVPEGTPVRVVGPGRVAFSGVKSGYGNTVVVDHGDGLVSVYAHNAVNCVEVGQNLGGHDILALSGSTGRSTGPHVHFEVWKEGVNRTEEYLKAGGLFEGAATVASAGDDVMIRRIILADGSVLFTNLDQPRR